MTNLSTAELAWRGVGRHRQPRLGRSRGAERGAFVASDPDLKFWAVGGLRVDALTALALEVLADKIKRAA